MCVSVCVCVCELGEINIGELGASIGAKGCSGGVGETRCSGAVC